MVLITTNIIFILPYIKQIIYSNREFDNKQNKKKLVVIVSPPLIVEYDLDHFRTCIKNINGFMVS